MSEISETEIKSMTKEQNYLRGYKDGKCDVLDKIRAEIADLADADAYGNYQLGLNIGLMKAALIIDKYKAESEGKENNEDKEDNEDNEETYT